MQFNRVILQQLKKSPFANQSLAKMKQILRNKVFKRLIPIRSSVKDWQYLSKNLESMCLFKIFGDIKILVVTVTRNVVDASFLNK